MRPRSDGRAHNEPGPAKRDVRQRLEGRQGREVSHGRGEAWPVRPALEELGSYFAITRLDSRSAWRPMREFSTDPAGLADVVTAVSHNLAARPYSRTDARGGMRVAASVGFLGVAARLVSPVLGVVAGSGLLPDLSWANLWWRRGPGARLLLAGGPIEAVGPAEPEAIIGPAGVRTVLRMAILPLLDLGGVVTDRYGVSPLVIRGNIASAIFGASTVIASSAAAGADPRVRDRAGRLAVDLHGQPELSDTGSVSPPKGRPGTFRRRSCCLLYRVPGTQLCGDCVLRRD